MSRSRFGTYKFAHQALTVAGGGILTYLAGRELHGQRWLAVSATMDEATASASPSVPTMVGDREIGKWRGCGCQWQRWRVRLQARAVE